MKTEETTTLTDVVALAISNLQQARSAVERADEALEDAKRKHWKTMGRLSVAQTAFDELIKTMHLEAPIGSVWNERPTFRFDATMAGRKRAEK